MDTKKLPKLQANNEVNLVRDAEDITAITKSPSPAALCGISHEAAGALQFYRPLFQGLYLRDLKLLSGCTGGCQGCSTREFLRDEVAALAALGGGTPECMDSHGVLLLSSTSDANGHLDHYVSTQATVPAAANGIETPRPSQGRLRKAPLGSVPLSVGPFRVDRAAKLLVFPGGRALAIPPHYYKVLDGMFEKHHRGYSIRSSQLDYLAVALTTC